MVLGDCFVVASLIPVLVAGGDTQFADSAVCGSDTPNCCPGEAESRRLSFGTSTLADGDVCSNTIGVRESGRRECGLLVWSSVLASSGFSVPSRALWMGVALAMLPEVGGPEEAEVGVAEAASGGLMMR